ncbi:hypothetical protein Gmet_3634 [Geobacter metallireducens GS-15]|uniref:Uncharacterized protein n=1 Tax=Geobacter metallireducens (strain ATCC 53774 / DSM 7210 / GS-15) TaxID=269799 RepID=J7LWE5_GEOMG|nr:hypothetical protein Gmet_3634 [Geobacter metallireducens GS-15]
MSKKEQLCQRAIKFNKLQLYNQSLPDSSISISENFVTPYNIYSSENIQQGPWNYFALWLNFRVDCTL